MTEGTHRDESGCLLVGDLVKLNVKGDLAEKEGVSSFDYKVTSLFDVLSELIVIQVTKKVLNRFTSVLQRLESLFQLVAVEVLTSFALLIVVDEWVDLEVFKDATQLQVKVF